MSKINQDPNSCIHGVHFDSECCECATGRAIVAKEETKQESIDALLRSLINIQGSVLEMLTDVGTRLKDLEHAVKEREYKESYLLQHQDGDCSGETSEASSCYCALHSTWEEAEKHGCNCPPCRIHKKEEKEVMYLFRVSFLGVEAFINAPNETSLRHIMLNAFGVEDYLILRKILIKMGLV